MGAILSFFSYPIGTTVLSKTLWHEKGGFSSAGSQATLPCLIDCSSWSLNPHGSDFRLPNSTIHNLNPILELVPFASTHQFAFSFNFKF